jgi:hypothetical protein
MIKAIAFVLLLALYSQHLVTSIQFRSIVRVCVCVCVCVCVSVRSFGGVSFVVVVPHHPHAHPLLYD